MTTDPPATRSGSDLLGAALGYAAKGWRVIPLWSPTSGGGCTCPAPACEHPGKHPLGLAVPHGLKDATTNADTIRGWWERFPFANIGVLTGPGSFDVLDVDGPEGEARLAALEARYGPLPETTTVSTGRGRHLLFAPSGLPCSGSKLARKLDTKGAGGYVVAPPSRHASRMRYAFVREAGLAPAPSWLAEALARDGATPAPPAARKAPPGSSTRYGAGALAKASDRVASAPEGTRNDTLNREAYGLGQLVAAGKLDETEAEAVLVGAGCAADLPEAEARKTVASGLAAGRKKPREAPASGKIVDLVSASPGSQAVTEPEWLPPPRETGRVVLPEAALHGLAGRIVRTLAPSTEADPLGVLGAFLAMFGVSVGRGPHCRVGGDRHAGNLFLTLVGPTSEGRKGTALAEARRVFRIAGPDVEPPTASGLSSGEGFVFAIRDEVRTSRPVRENGRVVRTDEVVEDAGVKDKRLLVVESELASVLRRMEREGNTLSALMRQAWDGSDLSTLTKKPLRSTAPHVGILSAVTPAELEALMTETDALNGWANRHGFLLVRRPHLLPHGGDLLDEDLSALARELHEAVLFARDLGELERDRDARAAWERVYPVLTADRRGLFGAVTARSAQQVIRLSLLYALLDKSREIRAPHLRAALGFWEAAEESARLIFGGSLGNRIADAALGELRDAGPTGLTKGELVERFRRNVYGTQLKAALDLLARLGLARGRKEGGGPGRPAERWFAVSHLRRENEEDEEKTSPAVAPVGVSSSTSFSRHLGGKSASAGGVQ